MEQIKRDWARETAAAAAKELHRKGCSSEGQALITALFDEADAYDTWTIHVTRDRMQVMLLAEWRKLKGRSLGGFVSAAMRRHPATQIGGAA